MPEYRDSDFTWHEFQAKTNNELADILGNFVNRTIAFTERAYGGIVPARGAIGDLDRVILDILTSTPERAGEAYDHYRFKDGLQEVMNLARAANKYFNDSEPWKSVKENPERCATTLSVSLQLVRALAVLMEPVTPFTSERIWRMLDLPGSVHDQSWEGCVSEEMPAGHTIGKPQILVTKIEDTAIEEELRRLPRGEAATPAPGPPQKPPITIDDFGKIDLRIGTVIAAESVPKSTKLLKLQVEVGSERRQVVAGIAQHYRPEDLVGKSIVVVFNLQAAKLMGQESRGMLLAASDPGGKLVFLTPEKEIGSGSVVK
jgi:methionyl-tRNA synthetase